MGIEIHFQTCQLAVQRCAAQHAHARESEREREREPPAAVCPASTQTRRVPRPRQEKCIRPPTHRQADRAAFGVLRDRAGVVRRRQQHRRLALLRAQHLELHRRDLPLRITDGVGCCDLPRTLGLLLAGSMPDHEVLQGKARPVGGRIHQCRRRSSRRRRCWRCRRCRRSSRRRVDWVVDAVIHRIRHVQAHFGDVLLL